MNILQYYIHGASVISTSGIFYLPKRCTLVKLTLNYIFSLNFIGNCNICVYLETSIVYNLTIVFLSHHFTLLKKKLVLRAKH